MKNILKKQIFSAFLGTLFCISVLLYVPCKINVVSATTSRDLWADDGTIQFIQKLEGFDPQCFYDNGQWTYGYGSKCTSSNHPVLTDEQKAQSAKKKYYGGHYITKEDALVLLKDKLNGYYRNVLIQYTDGLEMNQYQFDALLSATYNHGNVRADGCKACGYIPMPLVKYLQGEYSEEQARQEYPNWMAVFSGYNLTSRRMAELERFFMGTPPAPKPWYSSMTQADVGTDFLAYIINVEPWKHLTNDNGNVVMT
ncbi:MAG: hypothetical protein Q4D76_06225, partial [Oscillospiraceae bacterium]|nr:hypothetical protein [Oscillospiraceae bacterium]